jgi:DnaK suppressor protein
MDTANLERYKRLLLKKRSELSAVRELVPAAAGWKGDLIDQASAEIEADLQIRLQEADSRLLEEIEAALRRVKGGTYGMCENCNQPIARTRLEAVPWTRFCRTCMEAENG